MLSPTDQIRARKHGLTSFDLAPSRPRFLSTSIARLQAHDPLSTTTDPTGAEESVKADQSSVDPLAESASTSASTSTSAAASAAPTTHAPAAAVAESEDTNPSASLQEAQAAQEKEDLQARTVFVGGLSWNVDNEWLKDEVVKALASSGAAEGEAGVESVRIARNPMGKSRG